MAETPETPDPRTITLLLAQWNSGDEAAGGLLMEIVYQELHRIAAREMRRERGALTLQTTALVHEAYLRLCRSEPIEWKDRGHFFAIACQQLRRILVDHSRRIHSEKRGGGVAPLPLWEADGAAISLNERLLALDQALTRLEVLDSRAAKVVELRVFGGLDEKEAAEALQISLSTLKRDWDFAKSWLTSELG